MILANRMKNLYEESYDLLEMMKQVDMEGMINFSGGFPSQESYPISELSRAMVSVLDKNAKAALSYGTTIGIKKLREQVAERMNNKFGLNKSSSNIMLLSGSQQGLDLSGLMFINPGDVVVFELPSYLGALNAMKPYEARLIGVHTNDEGMNLEELEQVLKAYGDRVKVIYVNPDYQNPTGRCWSEDRKKAFMDLVSAYDVAVLEDGAYAELSYTSEREKPLMYYDKKGQVVYLGTFSKILCPGIRMGWICASEEMIKQYLVLKTSVDLSGATILQMMLSEYLDNEHIDEHVAEIVKIYGLRRDAMIEAIEKYFPESVDYIYPKGGIFVWATLPKPMNARDILLRAMDNGVIFMPGESFYPSREDVRSMRLNFTNMSEKDIERGIKILGEIIKSAM